MNRGSAWTWLAPAVYLGMGLAAVFAIAVITSWVRNPMAAFADVAATLRGSRITALDFGIAAVLVPVATATHTLQLVEGLGRRPSWDRRPLVVLLACLPIAYFAIAWFGLEGRTAALAVAAVGAVTTWMAAGRVRGHAPPALSGPEIRDGEI